MKRLLLAVFLAVPAAIAQGQEDFVGTCTEQRAVVSHHDSINFQKFKKCITRLLRMATESNCNQEKKQFLNLSELGGSCQPTQTVWRSRFKNRLYEQLDLVILDKKQFAQEIDNFLDEIDQSEIKSVVLYKKDPDSFEGQAFVERLREDVLIAFYNCLQIHLSPTKEKVEDNCVVVKSVALSNENEKRALERIILKYSQKYCDLANTSEEFWEWLYCLFELCDRAYSFLEELGKESKQ